MLLGKLIHLLSLVEIFRYLIWKTSIFKSKDSYGHLWNWLFLRVSDLCVSIVFTWASVLNNRDSFHLAVSGPISIKTEYRQERTVQGADFHVIISLIKSFFSIKYVPVYTSDFCKAVKHYVQNTAAQMPHLSMFIHCSKTDCKSYLKNLEEEKTNP